MNAAGGFSIEGPVGRVEALLKEPAAPPRFAAVVSHPHPLFGGTMHNKVVHRIAKCLVAAGGVTVRFQFRGVGLSAGVHDYGNGELDDLGAVLTWLGAHAPGLPLFSCGYSFGAWVALRRGASDPRVHALLGVGLATSVHDFAGMVASTKPKCVIQGERDALGPRAEIERLSDDMAPPKRLLWVPDADHFFTAGHEGLARSTEEALAFLLATPFDI